MAVTIVEEVRPITGGVDTHVDTHVAAALDPVGGLLGVREFPATAAGYSGLLGWLGGFGTVCLAGSRGPAVTAPGWPATSPQQASGSAGVDRSDRQDRRRLAAHDRYAVADTECNDLAYPQRLPATKLGDRDVDKATE